MFNLEMTTPGLREIAKEPFSALRHPIPGHGVGLSDVFGKGILAALQQNEEDNSNINLLISLLPGSLEISKKTLKATASRFERRAKTALDLAERDTERLFEVAEKRRFAYNQSAYFVSTAMALREHFENVFLSNREDLLKFVGHIESSFEKTNFELINKIILSWGTKEELAPSELELLKDFVFDGNIPLEVTVASVALQEHISKLKKSGAQMVPFLPEKNTKSMEDVDFLKWLLGEKSELPAYFLRISGLAIRSGSQAPAFMLIGQFLREIIVGYVGILNTRNMLATIMMVEKTMNQTHAVISHSSELYSAAVALAGAIGMDMAPEFKYYEKNWKSKSARESAFGTIASVQTAPTELDKWVLQWSGLTKEKAKELCDEIPALEIRFRMKALLQKEREKDHPFEDLKLDSNFDSW